MSNESCESMGIFASFDFEIFVCLLRRRNRQCFFGYGLPLYFIYSYQRYLLSLVLLVPQRMRTSLSTKLIFEKFKKETECSIVVQIIAFKIVLAVHTTVHTQLSR